MGRSGAPLRSRGMSCPRLKRRTAPSIKWRAQGGWMPHRTRGLHTTKKTPQVRRNTGTPCAMVYGLYVISPESGLVSLRRPPQISGGLDPSVGGPGQHDFARPPLAALVMRSGSVHRSPPHVRDDAFAPPIEAGC